MELLRKGLEQKWRNCLNRAEKNDLAVIDGTDSTLFDCFLSLYKEMLVRKQLAEPGDIRSFQKVQELLPATDQLRIFICKAGGEPCAGAICSAMGEKGVLLFAATAQSGLKNKASYLLQWRLIQWLKQIGCSKYDLHGSNAKSNPGVYAFKMGLAGKNGREVQFVGHFDAYHNRYQKPLLKVFDNLNAFKKSVRDVYGRTRGFRL